MTSSESLDNPGSVIDALGGTLAVARGLSVGAPVVSNWRDRGIPPGRWPALVALASTAGRKEITFEVLAALPQPAEARA